MKTILVAALLTVFVSACGSGTNGTGSAEPMQNDLRVTANTTNNASSSNIGTDTTSTAINGNVTGKGPLAWRVKVLGTLGGDSSRAVAINNQGEIIGASTISNNQELHAFVYRNGQMIDLVPLGGAGMVANAINDLGDIVGEMILADGKTRHAFIYHNQKFTDLGTLGGLNSSAKSINNLGQVVGDSEIAVPDATCYGPYLSDPHPCSSHAFVFSDGRMADIGSLGGAFAQAIAINNKGEITGTSEIEIPTQAYGPGTAKIHTFFYRNGRMVDVGTLGGNASRPAAINDQSMIVGQSQTDPPDHSCPARTADCSSHAFVYANGTLSDLGSLGGLYSWATGINNKSYIIGGSTTNGINGVGRFVYINGKMTDLNALPEVKAAGLVIQVLGDINDLDQIVGWGTVDGQERAFILTPVYQ